MAPRFPRSVYEAGTEPDARFSLANERTFLAWIRTALGLLAGGVALELLGLDLQADLRFGASLVLVLTAVVTPALAWRTWMRTERALREERPLPKSLLGPFLGVAVTVSAMLVTAALLLK